MAIIALKRNAELNDLIEQMHVYFPMHAAQMKAFQDLFYAPTLYQIGMHVFDYLKTLKYVPDGRTQKIQSPYRLSLSRKGDCKSYSIFAASVLFSFGAPVRFVYSSNTSLENPEHVFVQFLFNDQIVTLDATICCYDKEPDSMKKWYSPWMH